MSEQNFKIEQAVRQGGFLSADLYKLYINPLLNFLGESGLGGKIGNINVCAPTCADDVAFIVYNLLDIQTMVDIAVDFSKREGYQLQPATSVILPVKSKIKTIETNEGFWKIDNNKIMPVVDKATHIGITRSDTNSARTTIDENIRKARRATYSLMGTGLHGENGLDPVTSISLLKTYILPILTRNRNTKRKNIRSHKIITRNFKASVVPDCKCSRSCCIYDIRTITSGSRDTYQGFYNVWQYYKSA